MKLRLFLATFIALLFLPGTANGYNTNCMPTGGPGAQWTTHANNNPCYHWPDSSRPTSIEIYRNGFTHNPTTLEPFSSSMDSFANPELSAAITAIGNFGITPAGSCGFTVDSNGDVSSWHGWAYNRMIQCVRNVSPNYSCGQTEGTTNWIACMVNYLIYTEWGCSPYAYCYTNHIATAAIDYDTTPLYSDGSAYEWTPPSQRHSICHEEVHGLGRTHIYNGNYEQNAHAPNTCISPLGHYTAVSFPGSTLAGEIDTVTNHPDSSYNNYYALSRIARPQLLSSKQVNRLKPRARALYQAKHQMQLALAGYHFKKVKIYKKNEPLPTTPQLDTIVLVEAGISEALTVQAQPKRFSLERMH